MTTRYVQLSRLMGVGRSSTPGTVSATDPARALDILRRGLAFTRDNQLPGLAAFIASEAAVFEAVHGDLDQAKRLFVECIEALRSADTINVKVAIGNLADFFDRTETAQHRGHGARR